MALSGRSDAHYARWPVETYRQSVQNPLKVISGKESKADRSVAVNVNRNTIELRYWKGTLSGSSVIGQCAFIDALLKYAPQFADSEATSKEINWDTFGQWAVRALPPFQVQDIAQLCANRHVAFIVPATPEQEI
jgi:hypothetical protein